MRVSTPMGQERRRLRLWLALFFIALTIPSAILVRQAYSQLKWEAFHQHQVFAEDLAQRVDERFIEWVNTEEDRSFTDYAFLVVAGTAQANFLQRSPLSAYPVKATIPGLIGHFQVDAKGSFSTPLLPSAQAGSTVYGVSVAEQAQRRVLQEKLQQILSRNKLLESVELRASLAGKARSKQRQDRSTALEEVAESDSVMEFSDSVAESSLPASVSSPARAPAQASVPAPAQAPAQAAFDRLEPATTQEKKQREAVRSLGRVEDLKLENQYQSQSADQGQRLRKFKKNVSPSKRVARKESSSLLESEALVLQSTLPKADASAQPKVRISTFESELDPFKFSALDSGHFVLFRNVWRQGQRYIQGALIERGPFLQGMIEAAFRNTALSQMSNLGVAYRGDVFSAFSGEAQQRYLSSAQELSGALLHRTRLSAPLADLELIFTITQLPAGPGARVITWVAMSLALVLCGGFLLMYRLGVRQIALAQQQQDFVSAVSHELKTPLTSIRMYGEILREGWASEEKKKTYYDYIFAESERLSRLIANVLQLASMSRNDLQVSLRHVSLSELMDEVRSKISSQVERAGFELRLSLDDEIAQTTISVDADAFSQIVINLVDNGIKFSDKAESKVIDISWLRQSDGRLKFSVRDYGPGVPANQLKKICKLFYRSENELTRETVGTGIGLALVQQLASAMGARVDVINQQPGVEFSVLFKPDN